MARKQSGWFLTAFVIAAMLAFSPAAWAAPGDVDGVNGVELKDAVLSLKVVAGVPADGVTLDGDVDGDGAVGLAEAVFALRSVAMSSSTGRARAVLGPLAGATVKVFRLNDLETPIYSAMTDDEGYFDTQLLSEDLTKYVLVAASGGQDVDADDDGVLDAAPTPNAGTVHGLVTAAEFREGGFQVTALSDIVWQYTRNLTRQADADGISIRIRDLAGHFFGENADFDGDGTVDSADVCAFDPANPDHRERLNLDYAALLTADPDLGKSVVDCYHENLADTLPALLDKMFGMRLTRFPSTDPQFEKVRIAVSAFGEGSLESDKGGIRVVPNPADATENVYQAFLAQSATETMTLTATPNLDPETEILSWDGCDSVSGDKTQCVVGLTMNRLVKVNFGYKETILQEGVDLLDLTTAQVVESDDMVTLDVTAGVGDSDMETALAGVRAGTIVVSGSGGGFLRKVVSAEKISDSNYVLTTEDASLDEVIAQGTGAFSKKMTHGDLADSRKRRTSEDGKVRLLPSDDPSDTTFTFEIGDPRKRASIEGTLNWPSNDDVKVSLKGTVSINIDIDMGVSFGCCFPPLEHFKFVPRISAEENLELKVVQGVEIPEDTMKMPLPSLTFAPITFAIGPVPVVVEPEVEISIGLDGEAEVSLTTGVTLWQEAWAGLEYKRDEVFRPVYGFESSYELTPPAGQISAKLTPYVKTGPVFRLYKVSGPYVKVKGYVEVEGKIEEELFSDDPCFGGVDIAAKWGIGAYWGWEAENIKKLGKWAEKIVDNVTLEGELIKPFEKDIKKWNLGGNCPEPEPPRLAVQGPNFFQRVEKGTAVDIQQHYIVENVGDGQLEWTAETLLPNGAMTISPTSGTLGPDETQTVTASISAADVNNFLGLYADMITFKQSLWNWEVRWVKVQAIPPLPAPVLSAPQSVAGTDGNPIPFLADVTWTYQDMGQAEGFEVGYSETPEDLGSWHRKVIVDPAVRSCRVSGLSPETTYYFRVMAYAGDMTPGASEEVAFTTPAVSGGTDPGGDFTNSLGMTFNLIPAGTFMMGSPGELGDWSDEKPQHQVTLTQDFYIMTTEVTQAQWEAVMGSNPSYFGNCGGDCPVENVSWNDIGDFIAELNALDGRTYRLPTEAEWEYAARAGTTTAFYNGDITEKYCDLDPKLDAIGWYCGNSGDTTHPVAQKLPNAWGLYDMSGNVWEWVQDWYGNYPAESVVDPAGSSTGSLRVLRGGSWSDHARYCRSASRDYTSPSFRHYYLGFRLGLSPGQ